ncbi:MAG: sodium:solute symport protein [Planctomycetota bacterium]|nr:MAG: sodium:solute symport protein [Planctomycetota bacterium]
MDAFTYQYVIGGAVFVVGLICAARRGYVGFRGKGLATLVGLLAGLGVFAGIQAYLEYAPMREAPATPHDGSFEVKPMLGTPLDYAVIAAYFVVIMLVGTYFARGTKSIKDFFFAGRRFGWPMIAFSLIATTVGSYSFVKYSEAGYQYGLSSTQTYFNDWFWLPLLIFGWLPVIYLGGITSIPEYFQRRFDGRVRMCATAITLVYLIGYVGINLFTMGTALNALTGWPVFAASAAVAVVTAVYVTAGGQTSVIMTDLLQGVLLLAVGLLILALGMRHLGGWDAFWSHLPREHRLAFPAGGGDASFSGRGIFWQDGMANTVMFYFLNQGMVMRFLSARSLSEARKAAVAAMLVLMPLAAVVVASGGWVGRAFVHAGVLPQGLDAKQVFFVTAEFLSRPGVFGLVMAALTAALMSTIDSLITGVSAITVNDVYRPYLRPHADDRASLRAARITSVGVALVGVVLVPVFMQFDSIYQAHAALTASATPPLVAAGLLGLLWRRYHATAALWTLLGGIAAVLGSLRFPGLIAPFAQGVPGGTAGDGFLAGMKAHSFMRACFGLAVSGAIGVAVTLLTRRPSGKTVMSAFPASEGTEGSTEG